MHRWICSLVAAMVVSACSGTGATSPEPSPTTVAASASSASAAPASSVTAPPSAPPSASPTATPTEPPGGALYAPSSTRPPNLAKRTSDAAGEVRIQITAAAVPLVAGTPIDLTFRIENRGAKSVYWLSDGCEIPGLTYVRLTDPAWIGGKAQGGIAAEFKALALDPFGQSGSSPLAVSLSSDWPPEGAGCGDVGIVQELRASAVVERTVHWTGKTEIAIPEGPAEIVASFDFSRTNSFDDRDSTVVVEARLPTWISSDQVVDFIPPGPAVDIALEDPAFRSWLKASDSSTWINSERTLDVEAGTWQIGLFRDGGSGFFGSVTFDARTGTILDHRFEG